MGQHKIRDETDVKGLVWTYTRNFQVILRTQYVESFSLAVNH